MRVFSKRLAFNDKVLENINTKIDSFSSAMKDKISYNKKIESQLAQLAATLCFATNLEKINTITTRGGKSTCDPPYPIRTGRTPVVVQEEEKKDDKVEEVGPYEQELQQDFHETTFLPFPRRNRKAKMDEQFGKFVEAIQKLYINISLLDAI
jgi:rhamnose utilization protein RhaD (predicted bifunctional aldolase and dehydrogenase)